MPLSSICLWTIFRINFSHSLRCGLTVANFVSQRSSAFLWVIHLTVLATKVTAVLCSESWVTCHSFLKLRLCFSRLSRPGRSLLKSESIILLLDNLYAEAIGAVNWTELGWFSHIALELAHRKHRLQHIFYCCVMSPWTCHVSLLCV
jgi:hypothetical protein